MGRAEPTRNQSKTEPLPASAHADQGVGGGAGAATPDNPAGDVTPPVSEGTPAGTMPVPTPGEAPGRSVPGVQRTRAPHGAKDGFGIPANAVPGKPDGEVDTR